MLSKFISNGSYTEGNNRTIFPYVGISFYEMADLIFDKVSKEIIIRTFDSQDILFLHKSKDKNDSMKVIGKKYLEKTKKLVKIID
jgi:hypothetical protein